MREDLYEQCSDHMTEKTPSSTRFGSRPSRSLMRLNSSGVRLCAAITSGVIISDSLFVTGHFLIDGAAEFGGLNAAEMPVDNFTVLVVKKRRRKLTVPVRVDDFNCRFRIIDVEQNDRHRGFHFFQKLRDCALDVRNVIQ